jgi:hypothetical protein
MKDEMGKELGMCVWKCNAYSVLIGKTALNISLKTPRSRLDDNIKIDVK